MARFIARPTWPFPPFHIGHVGYDQRKRWRFVGFKVSFISNFATRGQVENPTGGNSHNPKRTPIFPILLLLLLLLLLL